MLVDGLHLRQIPNYPNYWISEFGNVWSVPRQKTSGGWLSPKTKDSGYLEVCIHNANGPREFLVHQLVALVFLGEKPKGLEVRHKNDDKSNNHFKNLCYGTSQQNKEDREANGRTARGKRLGEAVKNGYIRNGKDWPKGSEHSNSKLTESTVREILELLLAGCSRISLTRQFGVSYQTITDIHTRKTWKHVEI